MNELYEQTKLNEGEFEEVYKDTKGNPTIGIGFNLNDPDNQKFLRERNVDPELLISDQYKLAPHSIRNLYNFSMKKAIKDAQTYDPDLFKTTCSTESNIDMSFNLGLTKLNKFVEMKKALQRNDYNAAADEMVDSNWYKQVKTRGPRMVAIMRSAAK